MGGSGTLEGGEEVLDEESVGELVDAELVLVAVAGGAGGVGHDAGIADEDTAKRALIRLSHPSHCEVSIDSKYV